MPQIETPFQFFFDLYKEQHKEVQKLATKVEEAENLAEKLHMDFAKNQGASTDGAEYMNLRDKVFQICSMLYDQQSKAGFVLSKLEGKVREIRKEFTVQVLKKNYWEDESSVNKLFE